MRRSTTAMLPCCPTAPNRGRIPLGLHQRVKASHQKTLSLSQITYLGVALTRAIVLPSNVRAESESGRLGRTAKPIARREYAHEARRRPCHGSGQNHPNAHLRPSSLPQTASSPTRQPVVHRGAFWGSRREESNSMVTQGKIGVFDPKNAVCAKLTVKPTRLLVTRRDYWAPSKTSSIGYSSGTRCSTSTRTCSYTTSLHESPVNS